MSEQVEYRVIYRRNRREDWRGGFPTPDIEWESYFHNIRAHEVVRWERRTISTSAWERIDTKAVTP